MIIQVDKEKLLKEFEEKYVENRWISEFEKIAKKYKNDKDSIGKKLISVFELVCRDAILLQEKELKGNIKYIYFSSLRTSILKNKGEFKIDLYDENWFLDKEECSVNINLEFIYDSLFNHMEELLEKKNEYGRNITEMDIEKIKLKEANKYHILAVNIIKSIIEKFLECPLYKEMKKNEDIVIAAGEYMDITTIIYSKN
ncbi:hypothetical protein psyc5s11_15560 [Clostridium gelidum]|uniref:Uncharacterized protein n=1 Tax=Clostridium gelidum TaxID=704125 RepID=A0ABM7T0S8_9CLOT|nr:hypothetical protein [Clostridium gelidum]BCZ45489.1 hypothetical protein psyc5s11_15560 [Clostridium gelidum]